MDFIYNSGFGWVMNLIESDTLLTTDIGPTTFIDAAISTGEAPDKFFGVNLYSQIPGNFDASERYYSVMGYPD